MAKKLSILTTNGNLPFANNGLKLSENILIEKIEEHPKFRTLFSMDNALLERIAADMRKNSFDSSQPVHIWYVKDDDGTEHNYLIDGYTRLEATKIAGIRMIPYFKHTFGTFEEAYRYALHLQTDRRNLEGMELLKNIRELMGSDYIQNLHGNKNDAVGKELGISGKTVERANKVNSKASDEQLERIQTGKSSPNQIYNEIIEQETVDEEASENQLERIESGKATVKEICKEIKAEKQSRKASKRIDSDISDSLSDTSGNPSALNFSHSDGIERPKREPWAEDESDRRLIERYKEGKKDGLLEGFSKGAYAVYEKIFEFLDSGRTADEVRNDPLFEDFSPTVITKKFDEENPYDQ